MQKADDDAIGGFAYSSCVKRNARGARSVDKQRRHLWEILEERLRVVVVVVVVASRRRGKRRRFYGKRKEDCVSPSQAEGKGDLGETFRRFHDVEFKSGFHEQMLSEAFSKNLVDDIYRGSFRNQTGVSLKYMMDLGITPRDQQLLFSAQFLHKELPIRLAHRVANGDFTVRFEHETAGVDGERLVRRVVRGYSRDEGDQLDGTRGKVYGVVIVGYEETQ